MPDTDPHEVRLTGENSFIRLLEAENGPQLTRVSHWRIVYSPHGQGHALFIHSDVTDDAVQIYADNVPMTRWLQGEIESLLYPPFAADTLPIATAAFSRSGDSHTSWTETVKSDTALITLTWSDFIAPFVLTLAAGSVGGRPHGVYSCFIPARRARVALGDRVAAGQPFPQARGDKASSTACLALSETWVRP
ncbi:MAG: hypothetical protein M3442_22195 [Chloroflexota bacterium]|nr:hypothetical protein [Chloroflexota bacterium]